MARERDTQGPGEYYESGVGREPGDRQRRRRARGEHAHEPEPPPTSGEQFLERNRKALDEEGEASIPSPPPISQSRQPPGHP